MIHSSLRLAEGQDTAVEDWIGHRVHLDRDCVAEEGKLSARNLHLEAEHPVFIHLTHTPQIRPIAAGKGQNSASQASWDMIADRETVYAAEIGGGRDIVTAILWSRAWVRRQECSSNSGIQSKSCASSWIELLFLIASEGDMFVLQSNVFGSCPVVGRRWQQQGAHVDHISDDCEEAEVKVESAKVMHIDAQSLVRSNVSWVGL